MTVCIPFYNEEADELERMLLCLHNEACRLADLGIRMHLLIVSDGWSKAAPSMQVLFVVVVVIVAAVVCGFTFQFVFLLAGVHQEADATRYAVERVATEQRRRVHSAASADRTYWHWCVAAVCFSVPCFV